MKRMLRKWLGIDSEPMPFEARDVLHGAEMAMVAYRIDNGYLLRLGGSLTIQNTIIYCADEKDMADKIIVHRTKVKFTGSPNIITGAPYGQKTNKY